MSITALLTRRINARQVRMARIALGFSALLEAPEAYEMLRALDTRPGIVRAAETWWPQLPIGADNALALLWVVCAAAFCAGFLARGAGTGLVVLMGYQIGRDRNLYVSHTYFPTLLMFLLLWADPARALSVDALMGRCAATVAYWPVQPLYPTSTKSRAFSAGTG